MAEAVNSVNKWYEERFENLVSGYHNQGGSHTFDMAHFRREFIHIVPYTDLWFHQKNSAIATHAIRLDFLHNRPVYPIGDFSPPPGLPIKNTVPYVKLAQAHQQEGNQYQQQQDFQTFMKVGTKNKTFEDKRTEESGYEEIKYCHQKKKKMKTEDEKKRKYQTDTGDVQSQEQVRKVIPQMKTFLTNCLLM